MIQLITPNPDIPCKPGWCLEYVQETFGIGVRYGRAIDSWNASTMQHPDTDFPPLWLPVWFYVAGEPAGHVALHAPDGSVYSTSDYTNTPHHHSSLNDLIGYYAYYGIPLTYLGWTEDVEGVSVVGPVIQTESIEKDGLDMATVDDIRNVILEPGVLDAIALAILHRACKNIDPVTGQEVEVPEGPTLAKKVSWNAYLHERDHRSLDALTQSVSELHDVVNKLLPGGAHADSVAAPVVPVATAVV